MLRPLTLHDATAVAAIYRPYVEHTAITFDTHAPSATEMEARLASILPGYPAWAYVEAGKVVGYCYAHAWKGKAAYRPTAETTLYLHPDYTGKGIGTRLLQRLIDDCRQRGFHTLVACITVPNAASVTLHERLGFQQASYFRQVGRKFDRWLDVADYVLTLA